MMTEDGRISLGEDGRDGKRKYDDFTGMYSTDHTSSGSRVLTETSGKQTSINTIFSQAVNMELDPFIKSQCHSVNKK